MLSRKNYLKKKVTKHRLVKKKTYKNKKNHRKTHKKANKRRHNKKTKRNNLFFGGGEWLTNDELKEDDKCPICSQEFSETPDQAIYKTNCRHLFHNNCLNAYCNHEEKVNNNTRPTCPVCRSDLGYACLDVDAFADQYLDASLLPAKIKEIYENKNKTGEVMKRLDVSRKNENIVINRIRDDDDDDDGYD
jgi:hypothetical protein